MSDDKTRSLNFRRNYILILTIAISVVFFVMISSFLEALLVAAIGASMLQPVYRRLQKLFGGRNAPASVVTILFIVFVFVGPVVVFLGIVANQAIEVTQNTIPWIEEHLGNDEGLRRTELRVVEKYPALKDNLPGQTELTKSISNVASKAGSFLVGMLTKVTTGAATFFLNIFVMLYAMFFFLISGRSILDKILSYSPLSPDQNEYLLGRFYSVARATLKGSVIIGIIQGALGGIGFAVAGISGAAFWGTVMVIFSVVPGVGTAVIWVPAVIYLYFQGEILTATLLLAWCAGVVGTIDNVLRPRLVGKDAQMPDLLILLSTLGGIFLFGAIGFVIGPIIASLFIAVWEIYGVTFKDVLPSAAETSTDHEQAPS